MSTTMARAIGGPLDGQTVKVNGNTVHFPTARTGRTAGMFIYELIDYRHKDGQQEWILRPKKGTKKPGRADGIARRRRLAQDLIRILEAYLEETRR